MSVIVEHGPQANDFSYTWDLSQAKTQGQFMFWDHYLDIMADQYVRSSRNEERTDSIFITVAKVSGFIQ